MQYSGVVTLYIADAREVHLTWEQTEREYRLVATEELAHWTQIDLLHASVYEPWSKLSGGLLQSAWLYADPRAGDDIIAVLHKLETPEATRDLWVGLGRGPALEPYDDSSSPFGRTQSIPES